MGGEAIIAIAAATPTHSIAIGEVGEAAASLLGVVFPGRVPDWPLGVRHRGLLFLLRRRYQVSG